MSRPDAGGRTTRPRSSRGGVQDRCPRNRSSPQPSLPRSRPRPGGPSPTPSKVAVPAKNRGLRTAPAVTALVIGLAALTATACESELVRDIQRYCTVCWRNAHLDPSLWDDCTQEVCCRLLAKARAGELDLNLVLADDTQERRELVRAIDMVRKRVQRSKKYQPLDGRLRRLVDRRRPRPRAAGAGRDPRGRPPRGPLAATGPDRRALDPRLAGPRDRRAPRPEPGPGQRREVQGPPQARAPPRRPPRRARSARRHRRGRGRGPPGRLSRRSVPGRWVGRRAVATPGRAVPGRGRRRPL